MRMRLVTAVAVAAAIFGVAPAVAGTVLSALGGDHVATSSSDEVTAAPGRSRA
ncbi:hypothetical protein [Spirilliplanes yamanashiensis]|uniref:Uncharacterized protein n=1 Tax=Spirilliplanes yamanashiensis TaxID=42233 RepID=A0A8J4DL73_9ACTN|nr:hypothetical protein [Spirilliplanes yamanashiensis]MDP9817946.1 hypothetical protein [Spirilliplanes yamanashiensis]GIJ04755.1 hypothetical protein Sya03_41070 [Spirilliplanes yamanashiensis]